MGYRTNGLWVIKGPVEDITAAWTAIVLSMPPFPGDPEDGLSEFSVFRADELGYIRFGFEDWKWYENYPEVQWYEQVWSELAEHPHLVGRRIHIHEDNKVDEYSFDNCKLGDYLSVDFSTNVSFSDYEPAEGVPLTTPHQPTPAT